MKKVIHIRQARHHRLKEALSEGQTGLHGRKRAFNQAPNRYPPTD